VWHAAILTRVAALPIAAAILQPSCARIEQPLQLDHSNFWLVGVYATDPTGITTATYNMPPGLFVDTTVWLEAISIEPAFPWQVAPVVGGVIR